MRICMLNDNFYRGSGVTVAINRLISSPLFQECEVYLAGAETIRGERSTCEDVGSVPQGHYQYFPLMQNSPRVVTALYNFARWITEMRIDIVHAHHRRLAALANLIQSFTRTPVLFTCHLTFSSATWFKLLAPRIATGVSPSVVNYLKRSTRGTRVHLIHNPFSFSEPSAPPSRAFRQRALSVGRLDPVKGHDILIESWAILKRRGIYAELDIFGEGALATTLHSQIRDLGMEDRIKLHGFRSDLSRHMADYAFNILVSAQEGFPNVVVEAAAHRIPSLVTNVDGSRDTLPPGLLLPNGLPYGNSEALADALAMWFTRPQLISSDGCRFHDHLSSSCAVEVVTSQYLTVYESMLRSGISSSAADLRRLSSPRRAS